MKSSQVVEISEDKKEQRAVDAMSVIGISSQVTRSVLKNLLKAYDNNWAYIEEENYRLLADSVFELQISEGEGSKRKKDDCDGKNDSDNDVSNRKRPGKEIVQKSPGAVGIRHGSSRDVQIAYTVNEEVSLSLNCSSAILVNKDFRMPNIKDVFKLVEDRLFTSAMKLEPKLTVMNILKEVCECVLELGTKSRGGDKREQLAQMVPKQKIVPNRDGGLSLNERVGENNGNGRNKKKMKSMVSEPISAITNSLVVVQQPQVALDDVKRLVNPRDITNGQERYRIPLVCDDDVSNEFPSFHYIRHNVIYQKASVPISLARVGDENCCQDCYGDCLKASIPCACARESGGEYAYTSEGLLKEAFLDSFIHKYRYRQEHHLHYCQNCPVERIKNEVKPERCKGHLIVTFIKECWTKCGCSRLCGNRVVQRGIKCHLEVFYTGKKKGWGLRSPDELPKGTFVCEYVGEILTNMELDERTTCATGNEKHTYPTLLDADWASEGILDEESLCLDATYYGNVARFVNHRCGDGNLIEIPVEIETPDHHYYHVAFFTTRKVEPYEELCWDYCIDFDDDKHPIKAFRCSCGSKLCRDSRRSNKKPFNQNKQRKGGD